MNSIPNFAYTTMEVRRLGEMRRLGGVMSFGGVGRHGGESMISNDKSKCLSYAERVVVRKKFSTFC